MGYQIVNNNNWLPEGGNEFTYSNGYGKEIISYFWYDSPTSFDVTQTTGSAFNSNFKAIKVTKNVNNDKVIDNVSIYDYYEIPSLNFNSSINVGGWYLDKNCSAKYQRSKIYQDIGIYGK